MSKVNVTIKDEFHHSFFSAIMLRMISLRTFFRREPFSPLPVSVVVKCILWIQQPFSQHHSSQMQANKINIKKINFIASSIFFVLVLIAGFIFIASMPSKVISGSLSFVPMQIDRERIQSYAGALMGKSVMAATSSHNEWMLRNVTSLKFSLLSEIYHMSIQILENHISWYVVGDSSLQSSKEREVVEEEEKQLFFAKLSLYSEIGYLIYSGSRQSH